MPILPNVDDEYILILLTEWSVRLKALVNPFHILCCLLLCKTVFYTVLDL